MFSNPMYSDSPDEKQQQQQPAIEESGEDLLLNISEHSIETSFIEDDKPLEFRNQYFDRKAPSPISRKNKEEISANINLSNKPVSPSNQTIEQRNSGGKALIQNRIKVEEEEQPQQAETRSSVKDLIMKFGKKDTKDEPPKNPTSNNDEKRGSVKDLIKRFEKPQPDSNLQANEKERLSSGGKGGLISNRIQELQKKIETSQKEKKEQETWEKQKEERLQQQSREKETRATFMVSKEEMLNEKTEIATDPNEKLEKNHLQQNEAQSGNEAKSDNDAKSRLLDDDDDDNDDSESLSKSNSENNSKNGSAQKIKPQNPFELQITTQAEADDKQVQIDFRPTANFDIVQPGVQNQQTKEMLQTQFESPEKFSLMVASNHPHQNQFSEEHYIQTSEEKQDQNDAAVEQVFNPFAGVMNTFKNESTPSGLDNNSEEDLARASGNFGFFQGHKSPIKQDSQRTEFVETVGEKGEPSQILEEENKNDRSDNSIILNNEAQDRWKFKLGSNANFPVGEVEGNLLNMSHALSVRTDNTQDYSRLGAPTFKNKLYEDDKNNSFYLNLSKLNDNSMISQIGDSSMIKDNSFIKNKSQILEGEIKLIDLDTSGIDQETSFTNKKTGKIPPKPKLAEEADLNVVTKAEKIPDEAKKQANLDESYVFSKIDKLFEEGKDLNELNESKRQLLDDLDQSRNRIFPLTERAKGEEDLDKSLIGPDKQKELEFFNELLDISQIHQNEPDNEGTQPAKISSPHQEKLLFKHDHTSSSDGDDDAAPEKPEEKPVSSSNLVRKSKLRSSDLLNVSSNEELKRTKITSNKLDTTTHLDKIVDIEELKKGVPEYKPKQKVEAPEDISARKSKLRNMEMLNVSAIEITNKEAEETKEQIENNHNMSASFKELNKSVDIEELKKGLPEYQPKQKLKVVEDISSRKSKLRALDALNVSAIEITNKTGDQIDELKENQQNMSVSLEGLDKSIDIEELKKGVPEYKPKQKPEVLEDISSRKSKLRALDALNVSAIEITNKTGDEIDEQGEYKYNASVSFEGLNKSINIEELKKGVPEYKPKQKMESHDDISKKKSKLRNPDALNVSLVESSAALNNKQNNLDNSTPLSPLDKMIDIEDLKKEFHTGILLKDVYVDKTAEKSQQIASDNEGMINTGNDHIPNNYTKASAESTEEVVEQKKRAFATKEDAQNFLESISKKDLNQENHSNLNKSYEFSSDSQFQTEDLLNKSMNAALSSQHSGKDSSYRYNKEANVSEEGKIISLLKHEPAKDEENKLPLRIESQVCDKQLMKKSYSKPLNPFFTPNQFKISRASKKGVAIKFYKNSDTITKYILRGHGRFMFYQPLTAEKTDGSVHNPREFEEDTSKRIIMPVYIAKDNKNKADRKRKILGFTVKTDVIFRTRKEKRINKQFFCSRCEEYVQIAEADTHLQNCTAKSDSDHGFSENFLPNSEEDVNQRILNIIKKINELVTEYSVRPQFLETCKRIGEMCLAAADENIIMRKLDSLMEQFDAVFNSLVELQLQEDELDILIYLQRLFVLLQEKAEIVKKEEKISEIALKHFVSPIFKELQLKHIHVKEISKSPTKLGDMHKLTTIDSDIASSVDSEMTFVSSEGDNWVEYEPRTNSKEKESNRRHFYTQAVNIKLGLSASHPAREITISRLYEKSVKEKVPKENWLNFIKTEFQIEF